MRTILAKKIKILRKKYDLTQQDLADELEIKRSRLASYEECRAFPDLPTLIKITKRFEIDLEELLILEEDIFVEKHILGNNIKRDYIVENTESSHGYTHGDYIIKKLELDIEDLKNYIKSQENTISTLRQQMEVEV